MTVPNVTTGEIITEGWGDLVADDVNSLLGRATSLESRATALEDAAVGAWRTIDFQPCGLGPHLITAPTQIFTDRNVTYSAGSFTIGKTGIYVAQVVVTAVSGSVTQVDWRVNGASAGDVMSKPLMWGVGAAGTVFTFYATGSISGTVITGGHINVWRVTTA